MTMVKTYLVEGEGGSDLAHPEANEVVDHRVSRGVPPRAGSGERRSTHVLRSKRKKKKRQRERVGGSVGGVGGGGGGHEAGEEERARVIHPVRQANERAVSLHGPASCLLSTQYVVVWCS